MSELFILQNQDKLFLGKQKDWLDGRDLASLFKTPYKDEAINQLVEISAKDYTQRVKVVACNANEKGLPAIGEDLLPPPQPKATKSPARESDEEGEDLAEPGEHTLDETPEELKFTTDEEQADIAGPQASLL